MPNNLTQRTLEAIKAQQITPQPRWQAFLKRRSVWVLFALISIAGAGLFATASAALFDLDWDISSRHLYLFDTAPFLLFWTILIALVGILTVISLRKTEYGYRYQRKTIFLSSLGIIAILGMFLWQIGVGRQFNTSLMHGIPAYSHHAVTKETQWSQPDNGLLAGTIFNVNNTKFSLRDFSGRDWTITFDSHTLIRPAVTLQENAIVKIIGNKKGGNTFTAQEIRPWNGRGNSSSLAPPRFQ
jgi:hypothetical protein